jgi:hypothetical protein
VNAKHKKRIYQREREKRENIFNISRIKKKIIWFNSFKEQTKSQNGGLKAISQSSKKFKDYDLNRHFLYKHR